MPPRVTPLPWHELSQSAQRALADCVVLLADRSFTGVIEIEVLEGGIREMRHTRQRSGQQLGKLDPRIG